MIAVRGETAVRGPARSSGTVHAWLAEQFECGEEDCAAWFEVVGGVFELVGYALFVFPHLLYSCFDFVLWPVGVADEVEVSVFLAVESGELRS